MPGTPADLSSGTRITDYISLGVATKSIPLRTVKSVLRSVQKLSQHERALSAHVVVYYVIAPALYPPFLTRGRVTVRFRLYVDGFSLLNWFLPIWAAIGRS